MFFSLTKQTDFFLIESAHNRVVLCITLSWLSSSSEAIWYDARWTSVYYELLCWRVCKLCQL